MEGVDPLRGTETNGAEAVITRGRKPVPGCKSTGLERLGIIMKMVDNLVDEFRWDAG